MRLIIRTPKAVREHDRMPARQPDSLGLCFFSRLSWYILMTIEDCRRSLSFSTGVGFPGNEPLERMIDRSEDFKFGGGL